MSDAEIRNWKYDRIWPLLFATGLLAFHFLYALLRIQMQLVYQAQEPVFFFDLRFAKDFLTYPGGVNELCSRFYSEFFYYSWTGAAALILLFGAIAWVLRRLIQSLHGRRPVLYLHWVPSILLIALHSDYNYPPALSLGLLWVLLGMLLYVRLAFLHPAGRAPLFCLLQVTLYYVTAGQAFLFSLVAVGYELLRQRRIAPALFYAAFAALLPYAGASTVFMLHLPDAYTTNLISCGKYHLGWPARALYACLPLLLLVSGLMPGRKDTAPVTGSIAARVIPGAGLLVLAVTAAICSYDKTSERVLSIDYYARRQDWKNVLAVASQTTLNPDYIQYQANRALYHCGLLGDNLFYFVQHFRGKSLFLQSDASLILPLQHSDLFLDLGYVNEAQHWAHEAVSIRGDLPWNLQRLVEVNLLKGDRVVAAKYLDMLRKTLWFRGWANDHRKYLADANAILTDPRLSRIKSNMPASDFLAPLIDPESCLTDMIKNPANKMAFEYYMARCLLDGNLSEFVKYLPRMSDLGYSRIPRHFEEAILIFLQLTGPRNIVPSGLQISEETKRRFSDFNRILTKHNRNRDAAYSELLPYRDTYWFYAQYYYTAGGS
jgi:hypothetical protein